MSKGLNTYETPILSVSDLTLNKIIMKIEINITMDMILNHFPEHDEQDIKKALKTPKIKMLYGLMQWQQLAKNRQAQIDELKENNLI